MTRTRKIAVVVVAIGLFLVFGAYCVLDVCANRRQELRWELADADYLHRPVALANAELGLMEIKRDEHFAGGLGAVSALITIIGVVALIIGGKT